MYALSGVLEVLCPLGLLKLLSVMVTRNGFTSANPLGEGGQTGSSSESFRELLDEAMNIAFSKMLFVAS